MNDISTKIMTDFKVRKGKRKKTKFREYIIGELETRNIPYQVQSSKKGFTNNLVVGNPNSAKVICTAHYDTPFCIGVPNVITPTSIWRVVICQIIITIVLLVLMSPFIFVINVLRDLLSTAIDLGWLGGIVSFIMYYLGFVLFIIVIACIPNPRNANDNTSGVITLTEAIFSEEIDFANTAFIFFDNEEYGLLGSMMFKKTFTQTPLLVNFDCVGQGDEILVIKNKKGFFDEEKTTLLSEMFTEVEGKNLDFPTKAFYPSDQKWFQCGVGVCFCNKNKVMDKYIARIHTPLDTICLEDNIEYTKSAILRGNAMVARATVASSIEDDNAPT